jgi:hypothetical protein
MCQAPVSSESRSHQGGRSARGGAQTVHDLAARFTKVAGAPDPKLVTVPYPVLWTGGLFFPMLRELRTTRYQWDRPFMMDSTLTERTFGLAPTDLDAALASVAAAA